MSIDTLRRARFYYWIDRLTDVVRLPLSLLVWLGKGAYLLFCMISWGIILWVLGEKHIGVLKLLVIMTSMATWVLVLSSLYSIWFLSG